MGTRASSQEAKLPPERSEGVGRVSGRENVCVITDWATQNSKYILSQCGAQKPKIQVWAGLRSSGGPGGGSCLLVQLLGLQHTRASGHTPTPWSRGSSSLYLLFSSVFYKDTGQWTWGPRRSSKMVASCDPLT